MKRDRDFTATEEYFYKACRGGINDGCLMFEWYTLWLSCRQFTFKKYYSALNTFHKKDAGKI
jgi:hypothetical protein